MCFSFKSPSSGEGYSKGSSRALVHYHTLYRPLKDYLSLGLTNERSDELHHLFNPILDLIGLSKK